VEELRRQVILLEAEAARGDETLPVTGPPSRQVQPGRD
jgi:hypothetical protein